jgi:hypothetical protein
VQPAFRRQRQIQKTAQLWWTVQNTGSVNPFHESLVLCTQFEQLRLDFIRTDLGVCLTFAAIADGSFKMGHRKNAGRNLANAEKAYSDMLRFFSDAIRTAPDVEEDIRLKLENLRERLDGLQRFVKV